ncbi:HlyD family efflux transporter periplasmic adaptor subunit [Paraburkholderia caballeronis]|uniref:Putative peptide zinc metalloprotease protein n=1 Tax=Paraburkholderia caballeronis TaxID=416943 RepID=A0A1H7JZF9_9BURK|nr:HlyD family efflux transporter periplasmic adaptor subunit [Paraburkholderia caballeronis]PXW27215.1 putative peptide zinc metalloprotease protein [Paraburkholderia caballeronis]PXX02689.1 putative peptide zinc metalloprotease protein [Paraburkholderia caballeronis]RAK03414.1 putative peptide zinc metalloprotease protein [Paraburkholderia caballeronis]SEC42376.1 putative peptide zinc metalloprotease protein [Paraburkholderia caballeronis]SEK79530.1 putative peptide zinc metalloprotease prot
MARLPQLRQELTLTPGAATPDGAPTWMLHDPAANRFFQLGWPAFELLSRWPLDDPLAIVEAVNRETTLTVTPDDLDALVRMLRQQSLLVAATAADTARLEHHKAAQRTSRAMWLLKHYLMIRVPLWHPMPFLRAAARHVAFAYRPASWLIVAAVAMTGLVLVSRRWDEFVHTFHGYADWRGLIGVGIALGFAKVLHEFGHAFTAQRHGCRVPTMGVALLVMLPVLYTDTTEAWKVAARKDRLWIGAAGMLSEIALAAFATLAWSLLPDGPLRGGAFLLATTTWIATLAINASPFMRFDGYFLLSDWLDMPNLHDRAFALGRWWLREWLFGFGDPQPEPCSASRRRFLIAFSFATWLYRLVVFLSIALVVYHAFFKLLGMLLFCVEFGWFIVRPIWRETQATWQRRDELRWCRETRRSALLGAAAVAFFVVPWHAGVSAPAVLAPQRAQGLYTVAAGYLADQPPPARDGQRVRAGDTLAVLASPDLEARLAAATASEALLHWEVDQQSFDERLQQQGTALARRWDATRQTVAGIQAEIAQLTIRAPFDGTVQTGDDPPAPGTWLPRGERVYDLIAPGGVKGDAYVGEDDVARLKAGQSAVFVASLPELAARDCRIDAIDKVNVATLDAPSVASTYGGPIPAEPNAKTRQLVPLQATWQVRFGGCDGEAGIGREVNGTVQLGAGRQSFVGEGLRFVAAVLQREVGF